MKIYFNRKLRRNPWGGGAHFHSAIVDYLSKNNFDIVETLNGKIDVIVMLDPRYEEYGSDVNQIYEYKKRNNNVKVIHRINDTDIARNTNFLDAININSNKLVADYTIFISEWVKNYYINKGFYGVNSVVTNGCNQNWFYKEENKNSLNEPIKLVTHHWSNNFMKGFDLYNALDKFVENNKQFVFTYIGRYNNDYQPKNIKIINPLYGEELGNELRKHDIYITSAKWEACGMHHIEGVSSGLPILYHRDGGAIPEICRNNGFEFYDKETFLSSLSSLIQNYFPIRNNIDYSILDIDKCCEKYMNIIKKI
jgi:hypothetical protein